jgi:hypothetical protein
LKIKKLTAWKYFSHREPLKSFQFSTLVDNTSRPIAHRFCSWKPQFEFYANPHEPKLFNSFESNNKTASRQLITWIFPQSSIKLNNINPMSGTTCLNCSRYIFMADAFSSSPSRISKSDSKWFSDSMTETFLIFWWSSNTYSM